MFAGQPVAAPPPQPKRLIPAFPYWELLPLLPSEEEWRRFFGIERAACPDNSYKGLQSNRKPSIERLRGDATDRSMMRETVVAGDAAIPLCSPRDIAIGLDGELHILDMHPRMWNETPGLRALVKVYDEKDALVRVFAVAEDIIALSVDSLDQVWTSSRKPGGIIRVYGRGARKEPEPVRVIDGWNVWAADVNGVAVDSRGTSYVATDDAVVVYPAGARKDDAPIRKISGPDTFLRGPVDLGVGPGDTLYVLNASSGWRCDRGAPPGVAVTVYPPDADGNASPVRTIKLSEADGFSLHYSFFHRPLALTVDRKGAVYVALGMAGTIAVFAPGASGDVVPVRTLSASGSARALAVGKDGALYALTFPEMMPVSCRSGR